MPLPPWRGKVNSVRHSIGQGGLVPLPPWWGKVGMGGGISAAPDDNIGAEQYWGKVGMGGGKLSSSDAKAIPTPVSSGRWG
jgi:hypothetical protein